MVTVRDFGAGIRPLADVEHRSLRLGLPLIAALTESFEISGAPGRGTEVTMRVPLSPERQRARPPAPEAGRRDADQRCPPASCWRRCSRG